LQQSNLMNILPWLQTLRDNEIKIHKTGRSTGWPSDPLIEQFGTDAFIQPGTRGYAPL
jgi:hypothetical protein